MEDTKTLTLLWTVPEFPFRVTIPATLLNEIRIVAVEAFYSVPRGGVEVGGVFFGTREGDTIQIQAHRPIHCTYATGPSFTLSVKDQLGLSGLLEQAPGDPDLAGMVPLGWYHSHTRSEIFLSPVDLQLYKDFFYERWQIALVLRPANLHPTRAGFFFRDRAGNLKSDAPVAEYQLEPPTFGLSAMPEQAIPDAMAVSTVPEVPTARLAPPPPKLHLVTPEAAVAATAAGSRGTANGTSDGAALLVVPEKPVIAKVEPAELASVKSAPPAVLEMKPQRRDEKPVELPDLPAEVPVDLGLRSFDMAESAAGTKPRSGWIWALVAVVLACGIGTAAFLKWGGVAKAEDLGLETYDINGAFLVRWDRNSQVVRGATHATLEISDGGEKIPIELSYGELSAGGYGYMRRTAQVSVRLKVDGSRPTEEYSNFKGSQALGSQSSLSSNGLTQAAEEKEHLKTELINESMQSSELRREINSLRRQLAEERAKSSGPAHTPASAPAPQ